MSTPSTTGNPDLPTADEDLPIKEDALFYRRIPSNQVVEDEDSEGNKRKRPSSACFTDNTSPMSLYEASTCGGIDAVMAGHDNFYLVSLTTADLKALNLEIKRTADGGPGHCEAVGKKTRSVKSRLAKAAVWIVGPTEH